VTASAQKTPGSQPVFYDTHAHLDYPDFASEIPEVIRRAEVAGISKIITIGTDFESSSRAINLSERFPNVYAVVGWHPSYVRQAPEDIRPTLRELAQHPKVVALGETGLDYHRLPGKQAVSSNPTADASAKAPEPAGGASEQDERYKAKQAELFRQHLEVAAALGLNCVIHQRDALEDTLKQLEPFADRVRGVFHCFANDDQAMRRILALNSLVSFTGILTFKNGQNIRDTLAATPMERFMLETDSPYLAPVPYRGKRCEPAYVKEISETAAQVKDCTLQELSIATCATADSFFRRRSV
jgi:TatD DNase family protein